MRWRWKWELGLGLGFSNESEVEQINLLWTEKKEGGKEEKGKKIGGRASERESSLKSESGPRLGLCISVLWARHPTQ